MFEFLQKSRDGTAEDLMKVIQAGIGKLNMSKVAYNKSVSMIARAIAKCDFELSDKSGRIRDELAYRLNVEPNDHDKATAFWIDVVDRLIRKKECLIIPMKGKFYFATNWTESDALFGVRTYSNVVVKCGGKTMTLNKTFRSDRVIHPKICNADLPWDSFFVATMNLLDETLNGINAAMSIAAAPKFKLSSAGAGTFQLRRKKEDGTDVVLTQDQYREMTEELLKSDSIKVFFASNGIDLTPLNINTNFKASDFKAYADEIFEISSMAFDIPKACYFGTITEKADSTNEFVTYACGTIVEALNDALTAGLIGQNEWINGGKINVKMSKFKHRDLLDSSHGIRELREVGFSLLEISEEVGMTIEDSDFTRARNLSLNFDTNSGKGGKGNEGT